MTESTPIPPLPKKTSALNDFYEANKTLLDRLLVLIITSAFGLLAAKFHLNMQDLKQITNETKDVAVDAKNEVTVAAVKADTSAKVGAETLTAVAKQTGDPVAEKAAADAKAQIQAATEPAK